MKCYVFSFAKVPAQDMFIEIILGLYPNWRVNKHCLAAAFLQATGI